VSTEALEKSVRTHLSIRGQKRRRGRADAAFGEVAVMTKKDDKAKEIGTHLRKLYQHMLAEPLPDELARLLEKIDSFPAKDSAKTKK
jgi:hypothetical protein